MSTLLDVRRAGILLHPTSLPGASDNGELGQDARWFVDFLVRSGISVWQVLPLGPPAEISPYQCQSVYAGNPRLISIATLVELGWLSSETQKGIDVSRADCLRQAFSTFQVKASSEDKTAWETFRHTHADWLEDYALFCALKSAHQGQAWWEWPGGLRDRDTHAIQEARQRLVADIEQHCFEQFLFFHQWQSLKTYANENGVLMFGDLPIFVAEDSAEVWADRENFLLNEHGRPSVVAGVPPDYFSETGQRWGNPHYDWAHMEADGFRWWVKRLEIQGMMFDMVRVDHFRGFEAYWEIPADSETAIKGRWVKAPGDKLFQCLQAQNSIPLIAEDLGIITPEVNALREKFNIPGMKVLQFAFDDGPENPYLPHNHVPDSVVYSGTHDNNTSLGWFQELSPDKQHYICDYLGGSPADMPWPLIRAAFRSIANLAIIPMQDVLSCDATHRMNIPAQINDKNWRWRFHWDDVSRDLDHRLRQLVADYGRLRHR